MFKKIAAIFALVLSAGAAHAAALSGVEGFNPSKNVQNEYASAITATGGTTPDVYAIGTKHTQGNVNYGSTSGSSYVWMQKVETTATVVAPDTPTSPSDPTVTGNGTWASM